MKRILILDDDPAFRELFNLTMRKVLSAVEVTHASGIPEAIAALEQTRFDLVCLDLRLSPGDGRTVLRWIRARDKRQPVLVLSGVETMSSEELDNHTRFAEKPATLIGLSELMRAHAALNRLNEND